MKQFTISEFDGIIEENILDFGDGLISEYIIKHAILVEKHNWNLPGKGTIKNSQCGTVLRIKKCRDTGNVQIQRRYCMNRDCPICFRGWSGREANRVQQRLRVYMEKRKVEHLYHYTVSFTDDTVITYDNIKKMRKKVTTFFHGGVVVFHPYRYKQETHEWRYGPHFHIISDTGFVDSVGIREEIEKYNLTHKNKKLVPIIKNIRKVADRDLFALSKYEISHVGITPNKKSHAVVWFGKCAYNQLKTKKLSVRMNELCSCKKCKEFKSKNRSFLDEYEHEVRIETVEKFGAKILIASEVKLKGRLGIFEKSQKILLPNYEDPNRILSYVNKYYPRQNVEKIMDKYQQAFDCKYPVVF